MGGGGGGACMYGQLYYISYCQFLAWEFESKQKYKSCVNAFTTPEGLPTGFKFPTIIIKYLCMGVNCAILMESTIFI